MRKILVTITTTSRSNWRKKTREIDELNIKEAALFLTGINSQERKECYQLLKKTKLIKIPFVHLKSDMAPWELEFLIKNYQSKIFNIHSEAQHPLKYDLSPYSNQIYIENTNCFLNEKEVQKWAGICLDLSHLEDDRYLNSKRYHHNLKIIKKYPLGCNHISAVRKKAFFHSQYGNIKSSHWIQNLAEVNYLKNFPKKFFSPVIAIELENSLKKQLKVKKYIETMNILAK
jgi:hypothetical protein